MTTNEILLQIAKQLETIAAKMDELAGGGNRHNRVRRFRSMVVADKRFPGLLERFEPVWVTDQVAEVMVECSDVVAVVNYLVGNLAAIAKLNAMATRDEVRAELSHIEKRLTMVATLK